MIRFMKTFPRSDTTTLRSGRSTRLRHALPTARSLTTAHAATASRTLRRFPQRVMLTASSRRSRSRHVRTKAQRKRSAQTAMIRFMKTFPRSDTTTLRSGRSTRLRHALPTARSLTTAHAATASRTLRRFPQRVMLTASSRRSRSRHVRTKAQRKRSAQTAMTRFMRTFPHSDTIGRPSGRSMSL